MPTYTVKVDDNFHFMDRDERYEDGTFGSYEDALAACKRIVEASLTEQYQPGMTAEELFSRYRSFGDDPFISPYDPDRRFSAWEYAQVRAEEICAGRSAPAQNTA